MRHHQFCSALQDDGVIPNDYSSEEAQDPLNPNRLLLLVSRLKPFHKSRQFGHQINVR